MLSSLCCLNTNLCKCSCFGLTRNKNVKIGYIILLLLFSTLLIFTNLAMHDSSKQTIADYGCTLNATQPLALPEEQECVENKNTVLVFSSLGLMHFMLFLCMFLKSDKVKIINQGAWLIKIIIGYVIAIVYWLLVGTTFFEYLSYLSVWIVNLLYIFISLVFIDLVYAVDATLDQKAKEYPKLYILKAILATLILATSALLCYLSFEYNPAWISWVNVSCLAVLFLLAVLRIFPENSILIASTIALCVITLSFYVADHEEEESFEYNPFLTVLKGVFLFVLLLGMLTQGSSVLRTPKSSLNQILALSTTANEEDNRYVSSSKWSVYHLVMAVIMLAIPAVFCWENHLSYLQVHHQIEIGKLVWWGSTLLFYFWSLIAMKIFPTQDFSDLQNYFREYELK